MLSIAVHSEAVRGQMGCQKSEGLADASLIRHMSSWSLTCTFVSTLTFIPHFSSQQLRDPGIHFILSFVTDLMVHTEPKLWYIILVTHLKYCT
jgi:hypothetical protein